GLALPAAQVLVGEHPDQPPIPDHQGVPDPFPLHPRPRRAPALAGPDGHEGRGRGIAQSHTTPPPPGAPPPRRRPRGPSTVAPYHTPPGGEEPHAWRSLRFRAEPADDVALRVEELDGRRAVRLHRHAKTISSPAVHERDRRLPFRGPPDEHARRA